MLRMYNDYKSSKHQLQPNSEPNNGIILSAFTAKVYKPNAFQYD